MNKQTAFKIFGAVLIATGKYVASEEKLPQGEEEITEQEREKLISFAIAEGLTREEAAQAFTKNGIDLIGSIVSDDL